jgi:undecaprenyl-diphosphatase
MLGRAAGVADRWALRKFVHAPPEPVARTASVVGRAASGGGLWLAAAAVLAGAGQRGRRGAAHGLIAFGTASALANGPAKWLVRRRRPRGLLLADLRRRGGAPRTSSFPSSHTASAVAFAVAACADFPAATPVLVVPAAMVGLSRMRAVRHFPTDVVGGAVFGIVVGGAITLISRRRRSTAPAVSEPSST